MSVVSFVDFVPEARFDGISWTRVTIEESDRIDGIYALIDTLNVGADADPAHPEPRSFTTNNATLLNGWYKVTFLDVTGNDQSPVSPVHFESTGEVEWTPTIQQVAALLRARTKDTAGNEFGTFNQETRPTDDQVRELIAQAVDTLSLRIGDDIPDVMWPEAGRLAAIRTAMLIELSFFPEYVKTGRSAYDAYLELWREGYGDGKIPGTLVAAVTSSIISGDKNLPSEPGLATGSFPASANLGTRRL